MHNIESEKKHWANRAKHYSNLEWASRSTYLEAVVRAGNLSPMDVVLDAGTGTGLIAESVVPHVSEVIGVDISTAMMEGLENETSGRCKYLVGDIRSLQFQQGYFSKVFSRMVFHGLMDGIDQAAHECFRVLQSGGKFILSEGIPPERYAEDWYTEMFRHKENRLTLFPDTLEALLDRSGFSNIETEIHVSEQVSIRNWLENSGLPLASQETIMGIHLSMPDPIRKAYNAVFPDNGDVLIDMKFAIVVGTKP